MPFKVAPDVDEHYVDESTHRLPDLAILPLLTAVEMKEENDNPSSGGFDWASVDIVTDRNGLRKLLRWIHQEPEAKDFRIDTQLGGEKTVILNRWEKRTKEQMSGFTFGFHFEEAMTNTATGCEGTTNYHRIICYVCTSPC